MTYTEFGPLDVLHMATVEKPQPTDDEILIKIKVTTVNFGDITARNFKHIKHDFTMPAPLWLPSRLMFGLN